MPKRSSECMIGCLRMHERVLPSAPSAEPIQLGLDPTDATEALPPGVAALRLLVLFVQPARRMAGRVGGAGPSETSWAATRTNSQPTA